MDNKQDPFYTRIQKLAKNGSTAVACAHAPASHAGSGDGNCSHAAKLEIPTFPEEPGGPGVTTCDGNTRRVVIYFATLQTCLF